MFWVDDDYMQWAANGGVTPFKDANVNPASIDLEWSGRYKIATPDGWSDQISTDEEAVINPRDLWLLDTIEYVTMPDNAVGLLTLKSSVGRNGLEHLHAGFFDPGFHGTATLEMVNMAPWPVTIKKGQRLVQLAIAKCVTVPQKTYVVTGRYNGQNVPTTAR